MPPSQRVSTRCRHDASAIRRADRNPSSNSAFAASMAVEARIRALNSSASTSNWYSGCGVSLSRMPASAAYVRPCSASRVRTVSR
ncbi:hypothetical protein ACZ90_20310 [Streptomyces albus subsp. albus]|nr:hypothetical protein ACZ90_20310 [Streptomyces albus subsp. albus]